MPRNWKTTTAGAVAAAAAVITSVVQEGASLSDWKTWIVPAALALLGYLAGDRNAPKK